MKKLLVVLIAILFLMPSAGSAYTTYTYEKYTTVQYDPLVPVQGPVRVPVMVPVKDKKVVYYNKPLSPTGKAIKWSYDVFKPYEIMKPPYTINYSPYGYSPGYVSDVWNYNPYSVVNFQTPLVPIDGLIRSILLVPVRIIDALF
jgi:hypothetical protein